MTGEQLFTRLQKEGVLPTRNLSGNVVTWETAFVGTKELYLFFATLEKPVSGEEVYTAAVKAGFYPQESFPYHDHLPNLQHSFERIAAILTEGA